MLIIIEFYLCFWLQRVCQGKHFSLLLVLKDTAMYMTINVKLELESKCSQLNSCLTGEWVKVQSMWCSSCEPRCPYMEKLSICIQGQGTLNIELSSWPLWSLTSDLRWTFSSAVLCLSVFCLLFNPRTFLGSFAPTSSFSPSSVQFWFSSSPSPPLLQVRFYLAYLHLVQSVPIKCQSSFNPLLVQFKFSCSLVLVLYQSSNRPILV